MKEINKMFQVLSLASCAAGMAVAPLAAALGSDEVIILERGTGVSSGGCDPCPALVAEAQGCESEQQANNSPHDACAGTLRAVLVLLCHAHPVRGYRKEFQRSKNNTYL